MTSWDYCQNYWWQRMKQRMMLQSTIIDTAFFRRFIWSFAMEIWTRSACIALLHNIQPSTNIHRFESVSFRHPMSFHVTNCAWFIRDPGTQSAVNRSVDSVCVCTNTRSFDFCLWTWTPRMYSNPSCVACFCRLTTWSCNRQATYPPDRVAKMDWIDVLFVRRSSNVAPDYRLLNQIRWSHSTHWSLNMAVDERVPS